MAEQTRSRLVAGQMSTSFSWTDHPIVFGDESVWTMGEIADGWRRHIERFRDELPKTLEDHTVWVVHDWAAALHLRDFLSRAASELPDAERRRAEHVIGRTDDVFREMSELDVGGLLRKFLMELHPSGPLDWWWSLIPTRGPVREELQGG